jgi:chorismate dehydratase
VKLRIAAISFLNPAPLMWNFEHPPANHALLTRYDLAWSTPSVCAARLASGEADIGLVPIAAYASHPSMRIIPGCTIASRGRIRSILLVVREQNGREQTGMDGIRRVALDNSSRTSATYTRILFDRLWKSRPEFLIHEPDLDAMLAVADAALLIGDPALLALEDRQAREQRTGERLLYLDLGEEWRRLTGTAWVSAVWTLRPEALASNSGSAAQRADQVIEDFQASRDAGLAHIEDLVTEWSGRLPLPAATIRTYLTENIWYRLDEECLAGMELFYRYGAECGALPAVPEVKFLG